MFDLVILGGGPAGLQAALTLGRARRSVLVCDSDEPRNSVTGAMHGFISRDGLHPSEFRRIAVQELGHYPTVELRKVEITGARAAGDRFTLTAADGGEVTAARLILATGVVDQLDVIPGLDALWGRAAFHCPYCDGFERSDRPFAVIDATEGGALHALHVTGWSADIVLCTNHGTELEQDDLARLSVRQVAVREEKIVTLEERGDGARIVFAEGPALDRDVVFVKPPTRQRSNLAQQLGCEALDDGSIAVNDFGQTNVPGVYAAGDMARRPAMPFPAAQVIHAASSGGIAAIAADRELLWAEISRPAPPAN
jgi:thioredoxin reductase